MSDGQRRFRLEVPEASPFFDGHFPGHPILPGIAHLLLAAWGLTGGTGAALGGAASVTSAPLAEVRTLRLRRPVGPGDLLDLHIAPSAEDGTSRFELRRGAESLSQGTVRVTTEPEEILSFDARTPFPASAGFPAPGVLVPHAPPALLVRTVLEASAEGASCVVEIPAASPFASGGRAPAFLGLEAAAQTAAVLEALTRSEDSIPRLGYLVGVRDTRFHSPWLPVDQPLRATVRLSGSAPPLAIYEARIDTGDGRELVTGTVSTYVTSG
jgi:3-hydroxymyristoyl/3-hydroxydecanoyl-(acyl carrier protein) dehydratase